MNRLRIVAEGLDADAVAAVLRDRQRAIAADRRPAERATEALLAFDLGGVRHGLPIADVRAVAPLPAITRLPGAPPALAGLVAWRGAVANLFVPTALLHVDAGDPVAMPVAMIVLRHDLPVIAIGVDALFGVVAAGVDAAPATLARSVDSDDGRLTRIDTALLIAALLPSRLQEG